MVNNCLIIFFFNDVGRLFTYQASLAWELSQINLKLTKTAFRWMSHGGRVAQRSCFCNDYEINDNHQIGSWIFAYIFQNFKI